MKVKTSELTGAALDWAVCNAAGMLAAYPKLDGKAFLRAWNAGTPKYLHPSTDWANGGPIIDSKKISVCYYEKAGTWGTARTVNGVVMADTNATGPTPLVAATRCFVAMQLGDVIDIPDEVMQ